MACWSCGSEDASCDDYCECARCVDPVGYEEWKNNCPDEYDAWLDRQEEKESLGY